MAEADNIYTKLRKVQLELKAPKSQYNSFGKYNYRNVEDILEAAKPLCVTHGLTLIVSDEIILIGDRYYVKATAEVWSDSDLHLVAYGYAREAQDKRGMDESQITGAASSYARKYALNGLFAIDDTKDADTDEHRNQVDNAPAKKPYVAPKAAAPSASRLAMIKGQIRNELHKNGVADEQSKAYIKTEFGYDELDTEEKATDVLERLRGLK